MVPYLKYSIKLSYPLLEFSYSRTSTERGRHLEPKVYHMIYPFVSDAKRHDLRITHRRPSGVFNRRRCHVTLSPLGVPPKWRWSSCRSVSVCKRAGLCRRIRVCGWLGLFCRSGLLVLHQYRSGRDCVYGFCYRWWARNGREMLTIVFVRWAVGVGFG